MRVRLTGGYHVLWGTRYWNPYPTLTMDPNSHPDHKPTNQPNNHTANQPTAQQNDDPANLTIDHPPNETTTQQTKQPTNLPAEQPTTLHTKQFGQSLWILKMWAPLNLNLDTPLVNPAQYNWQVKPWNVILPVLYELYDSVIWLNTVFFLVLFYILYC